MYRPDLVHLNKGKILPWITVNDRLLKTLNMVQIREYKIIFMSKPLFST